ncbi:flagellar filament capping protein FliD [bacterium]|nr:flagellar filament capping protein FliD [bacterium]
MPVNLDSIQNLSPELQRAFTATVKAEAKPIQAITERKGHAEERLKLLTEVIGKVEDVRKLLPNMNTPLAIRELNLSSTDEKIATGTADKTLAEPGEHSIEVLQLATNATALTNRFEDKDKTQIGTGYFTFYGPDGSTRDVFVESENSTLQGMAAAINAANVGMKAAVVNDQTDPERPYRLIFKANGYGAAQTIEYPEFYFIDGQEEFFIEEEKGAQNARIRYQGFDLETPTNEVKELIAGVTLNLKGVTEEGKPLGISIGQDIPKTTVKMKDIINGVNAVLGFIQNQNKMDAKTPGYKTLGGDYGIRMAENRLRELFQTNFAGGFDSPGKIRILSDMGVEFKKDGLLNFDEKKFSNALNADFDETVRVLTGDGLRSGFINQLSGVLTSLTTSGSGLLSNQKQSYTDNISRMDKDIKDREERLDKKSEDLKNKLSKVQGAFSQLQAQQQSLAGMGGGGGGGIPMPAPGG